MENTDTKFSNKKNACLRPSDRYRVVKFKQPTRFKAQPKINLSKAFVFIIISAIVFSIIGFLSYKHFYDQYESIVKNRMQSGFWQSRAGIYAAPQVLKVGQKISLDELESKLLRSGYVSNKSPDSFWNGTYLIQNNTLRIKTNSPIDSNFETAVVEFDTGKIDKISDKSGQIAKYEIKPEMLTGRSREKHAGRESLKYEQIPENLRNAIIITEDRSFFEHGGIDPKGILRAIWTNLSHQKIKQGGSTITQQLVKNTFLTNERTFSRKFSEAFLALTLENQMSKKDIFTLYCNEIYLGHYGISSVHGVGMASRVYFNKNIEDISLAESASLASMIRKPNHFTLGKNSNELTERRNLILRLMKDQNLINSNQFEKALQEKIIFAKPKADTDAIAPYFVDSVIKELPEKFYLEEDNDDLRIYTTIDTNLQKIAENSIKKHLAGLEKRFAKKNKTPQLTLIAMDPQTGEVLAMVGGSDYAETQFNRATQAKRQPGSVFKPFIYAAALERGLLPSSIFADKKTEFQYGRYETYEPANYGDHYTNRDITLKTALAKSSNVVAVQTAMRIGLETITKKAFDFGFKKVEPYPSVALGTIEVTPIQLAAAYSSFANAGKKITPTYIKYVQSSDGSLIYQTEISDQRVISEETAYMITDMLQAVVRRGTARQAKNVLGEDVVFAGKTGSSNDAWFVGYTPNLVTVAWVGFDNNDDIGLTGGETALPLWIDFMKEVIAERPEFGEKSFDKPLGLVEVTIDPETGMIADYHCPFKERMVLPQKAVSNFTCYRHRVYPDAEFAINQEKSESVEIINTTYKQTIQETNSSQTQINNGVISSENGSNIQVNDTENHNKTINKDKKMPAHNNKEPAKQTVTEKEKQDTQKLNSKIIAVNPPLTDYPDRKK